MKKVWRIKLWIQGYRPLDSEAKRTLLIQMDSINEDNKHHSKDKKCYIIEDRSSMKVPSVLGGNPTTIHACRHRFRELTIVDIQNDELLKKIREYCNPYRQTPRRFSGNDYRTTYIIQQLQPVDVDKSPYWELLLIQRNREK